MQSEIGLETIKGLNGNHTLFVPLLQILHNRGIFFINQLHHSQNQGIFSQQWHKADELGLTGGRAGGRMERLLDKVVVSFSTYQYKG